MLKVVSVMAANDKAIRQTDNPATYPQLLAPSDDNPDPTPLLNTLARVALAIARRRSQMSQHDGQSEQSHEGH